MATRPGDDAAKAEAFLRGRFPSERIVHGGEVVGCRTSALLPDGRVRLDSVRRIGPRDVRSVYMVFDTVQSVDPTQVALAWADPVGPATSGHLDDEDEGDTLIRGAGFHTPSNPHGTFQTTLGGTLAAMDLARSPEAVAETAASLAEAIRAEYPTLSRERALEAATGRARAVAADATAFLETMDPGALALLRAHPGDLAHTPWENLHDAYEGLDDTMSDGALLRRCLDAYPDMAATLFEGWDDDPMRFLLAGDDTSAAEIDEAVAGLLEERWSVTARGASRAREVQAMLASMPGHAPRFLDGHMPLPDRLVGHLRALDALPARAWPKAGDWPSWCEAVGVVHGALDLVGPKRLAGALDLRRGWAGFAMRVRELSETDGHAWEGAFDCAMAFARQLLVPAMALAEGGEDLDLHLCDEFEVVREAGILLFSGDDALGVLARVKAWRDAGRAIGALARPKSPRVPHTELPFPEMARGEAWAPVLPGSVGGDLSMVPLADERSVNEALAALGVEAGDEIPSCALGTARLMAIMRGSPAGRVAGIAAFVNDGRGIVSLMGVTGHVHDDGTEHLPDDVDAFARAYAAALDQRPGAYPFPMAGHASARTDPDTIGYAWREPGAWEAVRDAWAPALPAALAEAGATDLAHLLDMVADTDEEVRWLPTPMGAPAMRRPRARRRAPPHSP